MNYSLRKYFYCKTVTKHICNHSMTQKCCCSTIIWCFVAWLWKFEAPCEVLSSILYICTEDATQDAKCDRVFIRSQYRMHC